MTEFTGTFAIVVGGSLGLVRMWRMLFMTAARTPSLSRATNLLNRPPGNVRLWMPRTQKLWRTSSATIGMTSHSGTSS